MEFNKEYWITQLQKEVGLMDVPYEEFEKHEVELASPTGRSSGFKVNAKVYVDKQLKALEKDYERFKKEAKIEESVTVPINITPAKEQLKTGQVSEIKAENIRFFDVKVNGINFTVLINDDKSPTAVDHINLVQDKRFFLKERSRDLVLGGEQMISIYQYLAAISKIDREPQPLTAYEKISENMDTVFDGLKLQGII